MTTFRDALDAAALVARSSNRRDLVNQSSDPPPCVYAEPAARTSCCGPSYACANPASENVRRLGTRKRCERCPDSALVHPPGDGHLLSVVIPLVNEDPSDVAVTLQTIDQGTDGPVEIIIVDDAGTPALVAADLAALAPSCTVALVRNVKRLGATRSREAGAHLAQGQHVAILDGHMKIGAGNLRRLAALATKTHGIAYCGCNRHLACHIVAIDRLPVAKWRKVTRGQRAPLRTDSMMGACYVLERSVLERLGGWIGLPGYLGWQELSMSVLTWLCEVPITCDPSIENWHKFRRAPSANVPWEGWLLNRTIMLRWLFADPVWDVFKRRLQDRPWRGKNDRAVPASLIAEVERPEWQDYGKERRARMTRTGEQFIEYLDWIQAGRKEPR